MRFIYVLSILCSLGLLSCNSSTPVHNQNKNLNKGEVAAALPQSKLNDAGTQIVLAMVHHYYKMKNALIAANATQADSAASELIPITDTLKAYLQKNDTTQHLQPYLDTIKAESMLVLSTKDESCERKRIPFGTISSALFGLLKNVDLKNAGIYRDFCPMAFNEKGAYWLSDESEIKNPYFGKKMIECGEITDSLK
jgi:hypothetical protein